jgi:hypothetical protein
MTDTPHLGMPLIAASQSQKHVTHNQAIVILDAIVMLSVIDSTHTAPPGSPTEGDRYKVAAAATGAWATWDLNITLYTNGQWVKIVPKKGWTCFDEATGALTVWTGSGWTDLAAAGGYLTITAAGNGTLTKLGILTAADNTNRLAVKSNAALFSHDDVTPGTGDMRIVLNKSAAGKDAAFNFQDAFSTRALFGLLGDDNFTIKVSADGSAFKTSIVIDKSNGHIGINGSPDSNNWLAVNADGILFNKDASGDMRITINKSTAGKDAGFTLQDNFSTRALFGLLGDDNFTVKVTPDASTFYTALTIDKSSGKIDHTQGAKFSAYVNFDDYHAAGAWAKIGFNNANHNDQNAFSAANSNFVAPVAGYYLFGAHFVFKKNATLPTEVDLAFYLNGSIITQSEVLTKTVVDLGTFLHTTAVLKLSAGDTVDARIQFITNDGYVAANTNNFCGARIA